MNKETKYNQQSDEIGQDLETGNEVNKAIEQEGDDAAAGILRGADAAKHEQENNDKNQELQGAP